MYSGRVSPRNSHPTVWTAPVALKKMRARAFNVSGATPLFMTTSPFKVVSTTSSFIPTTSIKSTRSNSINIAVSKRRPRFIPSHVIKSAEETNVYMSSSLSSEEEEEEENKRSQTPKSSASTSDSEADDGTPVFDIPVDPSNPSQTLHERYLQYLRDLAEKEETFMNPNPYGDKLSHEVISFDEDEMGPRDRYVYVEEQDCIGCTHCATTAGSTFFLESELGRARVFDQTGNSEDDIADAINTCPVNCIYYVSWEDLVTLELDRRGQIINNWARLVGGQDFISTRKGIHSTTVMDSDIIRCEDCPGRGCATCPMYGVGENPEYLKKKEMRQAKMKKKETKTERRRKFL